MKEPRGFIPDPDQAPAPPRPPVPEEPLEKLLWYLTYTVDDAPQLTPEPIVSKAMAISALWQVQALRDIAAELRAIRQGGTAAPRSWLDAPNALTQAIGPEWDSRLEYLPPPPPWKGPPHSFVPSHGTKLLCAICTGGEKDPIHAVCTDCKMPVSSRHDPSCHRHGIVTEDDRRPY